MDRSFVRQVISRTIIRLPYPGDPMNLFFPKGFHQILSASMLAAEQGQMPHQSELHGITHYPLSKA